MAQYAALWTSSRDPEFVQMRKVKQLTERYLAMKITDMKEVHRRHVRKTQEKIRESQDTLDRLEKEKETMARSILARYHRHQRLKEKARRLTSIFRKRRQSSHGPPKQDEKDKLPQLPKTTPKPEPERGPKSRKTLMTLTFPFVYHSYGDKPCPRYDMFLESTEYGPPEITSKDYRHAHGERPLEKRNEKRFSLYKEADLVSGGKDANNLPQLPVTSQRRHSQPLRFKNVGLAAKAVVQMKKSNEL